MNTKRPSSDLLTRLVIFFPLINLVVGFMIGGSESESSYIGYIRAVLYASIVFSVIIKFGIDNVTQIILFFFIYLLILIFFSSNFLYSLSVYLKVVITLGMFPVGYFILNSYGKFMSFLKTLQYAALLLCINYVFAQYFKIGSSVYLEDSFYYGFGGIGSTVSLTYFLLIVPVLFNSVNSFYGKWILKITVFLSILFTIIALKRIAIVALMIGYLVLVLNTRNISKFLKQILSLSIFLILLSPLYMDIFIERLAVRPTEVSDIKNEQRYYDVIVAIKDFTTKGIKHALVGSEAFNTPGYFGRRRQVHVDYANLLIGTGLTGLLLYMLIYYSIGKKFYLIKKSVSRINSVNHIFSDQRIREINGIFWAVMVASLVVSLSGGLHVVGTRVLVFTLLGGLTGVIKSFHYTLKTGD